MVRYYCYVDKILRCRVAAYDVTIYVAAAQDMLLLPRRGCVTDICDIADVCYAVYAIFFMLILLARAADSARYCRWRAGGRVAITPMSRSDATPFRHAAIADAFADI